MNTWNQDKYLAAWNFASVIHNGQIIPGSDIPYINHLGWSQWKPPNKRCRALDESEYFLTNLRSKKKVEAQWQLHFMIHNHREFRGLRAIDRLR